MTGDGWSAGCERATAACATAIGLVLPISTAADNVLLAAVLVLLLIGGYWRRAYEHLRYSHIAGSALALATLIAAGTLYTNDTREAWDHAGKYADLAFIPVFLFLFSRNFRQEMALRAFAAGLGMVLVVSYGIWLGWLPGEPLFRGDVASPQAFKLRATHNILLAYGAFLFVCLALRAGSPARRALWGAAAVAAVFNVTSMVQGATGYLILLALAALLVATRMGLRGIIAGILAAMAAAAFLYVASDKFSNRVDSIVHEYKTWQPTERSATSTGQRLEFYANTLGIIREHPWTGVGTGGFPAAYQKAVEGTPLPPTRNPHSEFLGFAVQFGIGGALALLAFFALLWREASRIPDVTHRTLARGLILAMVIGCTFNSLLLDHTEGLLFAWLTGLLYAGVQSRPVPSQASAPT
jgi:O-antigen ligase